MACNITFDTVVTANKIRSAVSNALAVTSSKALDDCNMYCKLDSGELIDSSYAASDIDNGVLIWDMPYAKRQYYLGTPSLEKNPDAHILWADYAASVHYYEWLEFFTQQFIDELMT